MKEMNIQKEIKAESDTYKLDYIVFMPKDVLGFPFLKFYFMSTDDNSKNRMAYNMTLEDLYRYIPCITAGNIIDMCYEEMRNKTYSYEELNHLPVLTVKIILDRLTAHEDGVTLHSDGTTPLEPRDILFRGKLISNHRWEYSNAPQGVITIDGIITELFIPSTISEFTNVHDINNNRIFEGDIVTNHEDYQGYVFWSDYSHCWMVMDVTNDWTVFLNDCEDCEVIGNVWDNPELIDMKEDNKNA